MEFLKELFGTEAITFDQFAEKAKTAGAKPVDLSKGEYISLDKFKALEAERDGLSGQIKDYGKQLTEAQKAAEGNAEAQGTIQALQVKLDESEKAHASQITQMQREAVDKELLMAARAKNVSMVRGLLGEIDEKIDLEEYRKQREKEIEGLAKAKDSSFAFDAGPQMKGAKLGQGKDSGQSESTDESAQVAARIAKSVGETATGQSNYFN